MPGEERKVKDRTLMNQTLTVRHSSLASFQRVLHPPHGLEILIGFSALSLS
jgi:hypothetical protein